MEVKRILTGGNQENCYLVWDEEKHAVLIDPGADADKIYEEVQTNGLTVEKIILTHGHYDHTGAVNPLKELTNALVVACQEEKPLMEDSSLSMGILKGDSWENPQVDCYVSDGEHILVGGLDFLAMHTPGHTAGSMGLLCQKTLFSGDTVFRCNIGRWDLPTGDLKKLTFSILYRIFCLPKDTVIYPGHGAETTVGYEKTHSEVYRWLST